MSEKSNFAIFKIKAGATIYIVNLYYSCHYLSLCENSKKFSPTISKIFWQTSKFDDTPSLKILLTNN